MKTLTQKLAIFFLALSFVACSDDETPNPILQAPISAVAASNSDLSTLVAALNRAGLTATLSGTTTYTVFAPTNDAFNDFLEANGFANLEAVPVPLLKEVLLNHVVAGKIGSGQLTTTYVKTLAKGSASSTNTLSLYVDTSSGVVLNGGVNNGGATVTMPDIQASNGVIHIVNGVLALPTVVNHAIANPNFSILVQALTRDDQPDFAGILSGSANSPFTVFVPTNTAFSNLLTELGLNNLSDIPQATLEKTLKYHVVTGANVLSTSLTNNMVVDTFAGDSFTVGLTSGAKITDYNGRVSSIIATDVQSSNGVIHVVDKVLLPNLN